uniref:Uncharacterized protein n=1 Tax=Cacopsylla melanoneura TaxID=428564 RepID=A0A8D8X717_9HEMI
MTRCRGAGVGTPTHHTSGPRRPIHVRGTTAAHLQMIVGARWTGATLLGSGPVHGRYVLREGEGGGWFVGWGIRRIGVTARFLDAQVEGDRLSLSGWWITAVLNHRQGFTLGLVRGRGALS